jgi:hypothetical protein
MRQPDLSVTFLFEASRPPMGGSNGGGVVTDCAHPFGGRGLSVTFLFEASRGFEEGIRDWGLEGRYRCGLTGAYVALRCAAFFIRAEGV